MQKKTRTLFEPQKLTFLKNKSGFITEWLILLSCLGYPLQAMVVLASDANSSTINLSFRAFYLLLASMLLLASVPAFFVFIRSLNWKKPVNSLARADATIWPVIILIFFWIVYGIRLVYELEYQDWMFRHYSDFYIYSWAFGCTFIPAIAVLVNVRFINLKRFTSNAILLLALANLCILFSLGYYSGNGLSGIFGNRGEVLLQGETDRPDLSLINSITISLFGEWLAIASLAFMFFYRNQVPVWQSLLLLIAFLLGIFNLIAGASRGPLLDFLLIITGFALIGLITLIKKFLKLNHLKLNHLILNHLILNHLKLKTISFSSLLWIIVFILIVAVGIWKLSTMDLNNLAIIPRLQETLTEAQEGSEYSRLTIWKRAWYQFTVNPIFGDSIINDVGYFYSHNILMDSLMSVGIVGTIPFLLWFFLSFWYYFRLPIERKKELSVLFVLYLAALLLSMTSGGIFTVPEVWILSAAVIGLSQKYLEDNRLGT